jgi:endonuclease/exonuclease/phosphatase family metal-dependent hydrolase
MLKFWSDMRPKISLACVNIEMSEHLDEVCEFLSRRKPEVVCIQELCEPDIERLAAALDDAAYVFAPMTRRTDASIVMGIAVFSRLAITQKFILPYRGSPEIVPHFDATNAATKNKTQNHLIVACDVEKGGALLRIGTTHFTWTPDGHPDDVQRRDLKVLLNQLDTLNEFVICGDFNFPRGGELFAIMSDRFKDNIPTRYTTSIDPNLHRAGALELMVDGLFSTPDYVVSDVKLHSGVSDHCAITCVISRVL